MRTIGQSKRVFDFAVQLEGTIRSHGVHAAGVVIAPDEIVKFVPLRNGSEGRSGYAVFQWVRSRIWAS